MGSRRSAIFPPVTTPPMAAMANGAVTAQSMDVVARRVERATAELMAMTRSEVPIASGMRSLRTRARAGTITNPPPTPNSPVRNPTALPAARTVTMVLALSGCRVRVIVPLAPERDCWSSRASPALVQLGQPVSIRQAATTTRPAKPSRSRLGLTCRLSADPASDPPIPVRPNTVPTPGRTRPARQWVTMPTAAAEPTRRRLVAVAALGSWPAA